MIQNVCFYFHFVLFYTFTEHPRMIAYWMTILITENSMPPSPTPPPTPHQKLFFWIAPIKKNTDRKEFHVVHQFLWFKNKVHYNFHAVHQFLWSKSKVLASYKSFSDIKIKVFIVHVFCFLLSQTNKNTILFEACVWFFLIIKILFI